MVIQSVPIDNATMPKIWKIKLDTFWTKLCQSFPKSDENENLIFLNNEKLTDQSIFQIGTMIADWCTAESENSRNNSRYLATQGNEKKNSHGLNNIFSLYNIWSFI